MMSPEEDEVRLLSPPNGVSWPRRVIRSLLAPESLFHRLIALSLMCLLGFGSYFCFDNPGALQREIKDTMAITTYQFANLYSWYSWPNVILPVIGGYLMDSVFGMRLATVIFAAFIILGQLMFAGGAFLGFYSLMELGRFVFGIGGESLAVAQNTYAVSWFKGKELNMVFGFQLSFARVGSTVNFLAVGPLFAMLEPNFEDNHTTLGYTLLIAGLTCVVSFISALILGWLDKRAERLLDKEKTESGEVVRLRDVTTFPASFWLASVVCLAYYVAIFPFISLGQVFFMKKYELSPKSANFINGLIYLVSAPASPLLGFLLDKAGRNLSFVCLAISATMLGHGLLAFTFVTPYLPVLIMGVSYSLLASSLWPIAALIIPEYQLGTGYGLMQAIQNLGLALNTMLAGLIVDKLGYLWLELFFIFWLAVALVCTIAIWVIDVYTTGYLNMSIGEREAYDARIRRLEEAEAQREQRFKELTRPRTANELRNRYLSRIGAHLPPHAGHSSLLNRTPSIPRNLDVQDDQVVHS